MRKTYPNKTESATGTGNSRFEKANPPRPAKWKSGKFLLGKILDSVHFSTISTQTSNTYWQQLQRYHQFAKLYLVSPIATSIHPSSIIDIETDRQWSITIPGRWMQNLTICHVSDLSVHIRVAISVCENCATVRGESPIHQIMSGYWRCSVMFRYRHLKGNYSNLETLNKVGHVTWHSFDGASLGRLGDLEAGCQKKKKRTGAKHKGLPTTDLIIYKLM